MPALLPVAGVARVSVRGTAQGQSIVNVFHVRHGTGAMQQPVVQYIADLVQTSYQLHFVPILNLNYSGDIVTAVDLSSINGLVATAVLGGTAGSAGTQIPQSAACCITWRIGRHYRGGHPRTYIGPLGGTAIESSVSLAAAFVTSMITKAQAFMNAINAGSTSGQPTRFVAVHRQYNQALLNPPEVSDILSGTVDARIDTMRRRLGPDR